MKTTSELEIMKLHPSRLIVVITSLSSRLINIPCLLVCLWTKINIALNQCKNCLITPSFDVDSASSAWNLRPHLLQQSFICPANFDSSWIPEGLGHSTHRIATLLQMNTIAITPLKTDLYIVDSRDSSVLNYSHRLIAVVEWRLHCGVVVIYISHDNYWLL